MVGTTFTLRGRWSRRASLGLAISAVLTPCAILVATLPGDGKNGFIDIGSLWFWHGLPSIKPVAASCHRGFYHGGSFPPGKPLRECFKAVPGQPDLLLDGTHLRLWLVGICALGVAVGLVTAFFMRKDHGLLFGGATVFTALSAVAALASVFVRRHVEDQAGRMFLVLVALSIILLVLAAHDWARRQLLITALVVAAALSVFIVRVGFESLKVPPQWERAQIADRATTVEKALKLQRKPLPPVDPKALDRAICAIYSSPSSKVCKEFDDLTAITENRDWVTAQHELDVQLAAYRTHVTGTQAAKSAWQAVLARQPDADEDISMMAAIENGPQTLWRSAFHMAGPALAPGPLGWVVLGAVLLWLLTWLLKVNASQLSGPVSVAPISSGGSDQLTAALRVAVLQNVAEPGAAPGSPSINPVNMLLDIAGGPLSAVSKIVQAVQAAAGQRYGYQVTTDITSGDLAGPGLVTADAGAGSSPHSGECTTVLVRVMSLANGITYASHLCASPDPVEAIRTAGLWAAGYILNRSSRIPHWAAWQAETAHALVTVKDASEHTIPVLKAALADAPNSGLLLVLLGHCYELDGRMLDAIECYARAVTAYDRYPVARYRLAAALDSIRPDRDCSSPDWREREDGMRHAVKSAVDAVKINGNRITGLKIENLNQQEFKDLARRLFRSLETDTRLRYRLVDALRRSEREYVWPALLPMSQHPAARFPALVKSARRGLDYEKAGPEELEKLGKKLDKKANKDNWWQISYNAACAHAARIEAMDDGPADSAADKRTQEQKDKDKEEIVEKQKAEAEVALDFLEQTLVRLGVEQLSADWVRHDRDLAALRGLPRFKRFRAQLRSGE
jgi:tetratricopeptide (TPR) repeat protein